jgi:hypothetical protein
MIRHSPPHKFRRYGYLRFFAELSARTDQPSNHAPDIFDATEKDAQMARREYLPTLKTVNITKHPTHLRSKPCAPLK